MGVLRKVYANGSDMKELYGIPPAVKEISFEGLSWQRENFLNR